MPDEMNEEEQFSADGDDLFDEFADAKDSGDAIADDGADELGDDLDAQIRDEQGRFAAGDDPDEDPDPLPLAAEAVPETNWQEKATQWEHRYNSDLGRQNSLQRKIAEQDATIQQMKSQPAANPGGSGMSDDQWESLKQDFPEVADGVEAKLNAITSGYEERITQLQSQMQPIQQQAEHQQQENERQFINSQLQILQEKHSDWNVVGKSNDYREWLSVQRPSIRSMGKSHDAEDAIELLDRYKQDTGETQKQQQADDLKAKRQRQLQSSQTVSRRGVINQDLDSEDALFDHFAAKHDQKRQRRN